MKPVLQLSLVVAMLASGAVYADCQKCHDDYMLDMQYCAKLDVRSRPNCEARANEAFNSCAKAFGCK